MIIGTAGHIDHGKTALVRALTGVDTDRLPEEKRRGITIDLGFAPLVLDEIGVVGIVDVPGHEDFVRSMLVGATGIDVGLLVIAADEGVMPQTREHLLILQLLKVPRLVVALTKSDTVDAEWLALIRGEVEALVADSAAPRTAIVSCSSRTGAGLDELRGALSAALQGTASRSTEDIFRLPVDRAFTVKGTGTVVTGTMWSGELASESAVRVLPSGKAARVRRIEQHGRPLDRARAGDRAAIALGGVDLQEVARGSVLVADPTWRATSLFEAALEFPGDPSDVLSPRTELRLHAGSSETGARVVFVPTDHPNTMLLGRITTAAPITLRGGDRFVLRLPAPLRTFGGGVVVDPYARRRVLPELAHDEIRALADDPAARLRYVLDAQELTGIPIDTLPVRVGCTPAQVGAFIETVGARPSTHNLFARGVVEQVMATVQRIVAEYEIKSPLSPGIPARTLRERLRADLELADISIRELERSGQIQMSGPVVRRTGWVPTPTESDIDLGNSLAHDICASGREPPSAAELVLRYGSSVPSLLHFLERQGRIIQVEENRYYDRTAVEELIAKLRGELLPGRQYTPSQLRDVLGFSRKYLIPFLEFCDRTGVTERRGEGRILRQTPGILLDTSEARS
ncbi:MAG: selenocysteine-specific translation elongation factor [Gemmatimonadaceae bacterium]